MEANSKEISITGFKQRYAGKKAVVIGGTHGMGLATVRPLIDEGAKVFLTGKNPDNVQKAQNELGINVEVLSSDTANLTDIKILAMALHWMSVYAVQ